MHIILKSGITIYKIIQDLLSFQEGSQKPFFQNSPHSIWNALLQLFSIYQITDSVTIGNLTSWTSKHSFIGMHAHRNVATPFWTNF